MPDTLLFDLSACQELSGAPHGGSEYARSVLECLLTAAGADQLEVFYDSARALPPRLDERLKQANVPRHAVRSGEELQSLLHRRQNSRFYSALADTHGDRDFGNMEVVVTIHGLRPIELPSDRMAPAYADSLSRLGKDALRAACSRWYKRYRIGSFYRLTHLRCRHQTIIVPSEHTKHALLLYYPDLDRDAIAVLASPATTVCDAEPSELEFGLERNGFFLMVGGNRWVKNGYRTMRAYELLNERSEASRGKQLVIVGGTPAWMPRRWRSKFVILPYVEEPTLASLYANAFCLLYPSLNEGFGYPALEAMRFGTPVIASGICSLPEVLGDAALYANPRDKYEIANRCLQLLERPALRGQLQERGRMRYAELRSRQDADLAQLVELLLRGL